MVEHHASVSDLPTRDPADAWRLRRVQYVEWVGEGTGWLLAAIAPGGAVDGYAMVTAHPVGPTFRLGDQVGDLESLAVSPAARGAGVGTLLVAAARDVLRERGVENWTVSVVEANVGAVRLYEREGFRPFSRTMIAPVG
jgi:ribosomal protein S18 acetylase RimI-like enzyme